MLWEKSKYTIKIRGGKGQVTTKAMHGLIAHIVVKPSSGTVWSMKIVDKQGDEIYERLDHMGRLDDKDGLPVGRDKAEPVVISFYEVTDNDPIDVIFKVREIK